jgi:transposase InsO family protein
VEAQVSRRPTLKAVFDEAQVSRATWYRNEAPGRAKSNEDPGGVRSRRGPKTEISDEDLVEKIRVVLKNSPFVGEGHRKAWARLRFEGIRTSKRRVLRLMRESGLLAPQRAKRVLGPRSHDGTITTAAPNVMWGTDLTTTFTLDEGLASVFVAIDHCDDYCTGIHAAKVATRHEALEPIRQGVREAFNGYEGKVAAGLSVRHDHGSQYASDDFQNELRFLGIEPSPSFVRAPEGNGIAERFIRTLKEQLLWIKPFRTVEELRQALHDWRRQYNEEWLIERHGFRSPSWMRQALLTEAKAA